LTAFSPKRLRSVAGLSLDRTACHFLRSVGSPFGQLHRGRIGNSCQAPAGRDSPPLEATAYSNLTCELETVLRAPRSPRDKNRFWTSCHYLNMCQKLCVNRKPVFGFGDRRPFRVRVITGFVGQNVVEPIGTNRCSHFAQSEVPFKEGCAARKPCFAQAVDPCYTRPLVFEASKHNAPCSFSYLVFSRGFFPASGTLSAEERISSDSGSFMRSSGGEFTLIELLVVISIIAHWSRCSSRRCNRLARRLGGRNCQNNLSKSVWPCMVTMSPENAVLGISIKMMPQGTTTPAGVGEPSFSSISSKHRSRTVESRSCRSSALANEPFTRVDSWWFSRPSSSRRPGRFWAYNTARKFLLI